ncbi:MAG: hypothetical protein CMO46_13275 [Verrucomicrobiales bacterium]|nr:hypothetical protein [Verrucomicrobiales bacterium]|tara:strand:+ start:6949 stop:7416 length:468 start_codon:yes stop_codon:yes gene_type:complete
MGFLTVEVVGKFESEQDTSKLLYAPLEQTAAFRKSRVYQIKYDGTEDQASSFVLRSLVDQYADEVSFSGAPYFKNFKFFIDYGMKPGALDLEREAIVSSQKDSNASEFKLLSLELSQRIYIFSDTEIGSELFVRDVCNPAIHVWSVTDADGRKVA